MRILVAAAAVLALAGQSAGPRMAGSWTAEFEGRTFIKLDLKAANGTVTGGISLGDVEVDKTGALKKVGQAPPALTPIFDVTATGTTLRFARKDGTETDRFELKINDAGRGELQILLTDRQLRHLAADGIPSPKPFVLTKQ